MSSLRTKTIGGMSVTCGKLRGSLAYKLMFRIEEIGGRIDHLDEADWYRLLAATIVVAPTASGPMKFEVRDEATFDLLFDGERQPYFLEILEFALEVAFADFKRAPGRPESDSPAP